MEGRGDQVREVGVPGQGLLRRSRELRQRLGAEQPVLTFANLGGIGLGSLVGGLIAT